MKTQFTVDKEFIKEAYNSACPDWKAKLKNKFPEAFQSELEVGKWYKTKNGHLKFFVDEDTAYGFDMIGNWNEVGKGYRYSFRSDNYWTPATDKEVETALISEAKRRGFKGGMKIKDGENIRTIFEEGSYYYNPNINTLHYKGVTLFNNGKWAEIISEPIELTLEQRIERIEEQLKIKK